jgi:hypothetical protein
MPERTDNDLKAFESKLNAVHMYSSERLVAMSALRNGFVLVERAAWAAQKVRQLARWATTLRLATTSMR